MNSIYTICEELLTFHIDDEFEISELADSTPFSISVLNGDVGFGGELSDEQANEILDKYKFRKILPTINIDLTLIGYVEKGEFFLFSVVLRGEDKEMLPERRCSFVEFFNTNPDGIRLRHVPVLPTTLTLVGAKRALSNGSTMSDVVKYTTKAIVEICSGPSPMTGRPRKGFVFKSRTTDFVFKAYSEEVMMFGSL